MKDILDCFWRAEMPTIIVDILKGGKLSVEVDGVTGKSCESLTKALEEAVGQVEQKTSKSHVQTAEACLD